MVISMSRIGKMPVAIPSGVEVNVSGQNISVKGPKGTLTHVLPELITPKKEENSLVLARANDERAAKSLHGLSRTLVSNILASQLDIQRRFKSSALVTKLPRRARILSLHLATHIQFLLQLLQESHSPSNHQQT